MTDLTIIFLTLNQHRPLWTDFQTSTLLDAAGDFPIISISREPMSLGHNIIQFESPSYFNIYVQLFRGAVLAETPFIAVAEDDTLYTRDHFTSFRPPPGTVAYDMSRWNLITWESPAFYNHIGKISNAMMLGDRETVISAINERIAKYPRKDTVIGEVGKPTETARFGLTPVPIETWYAKSPSVNVYYRNGLSHTKRPGMKKRLGSLTAYDIPHWGAAESLKERFFA